MVSQEKIYEQKCIDFRDLNQLFWRVPVLAVAVNGGLFLVATETSDLSAQVRSYLFLFLVLCNIGFGVILFRLRFGLMAKLLNDIKKLENADTADNKDDNSGGGDYRVISVFFAALLVATLFNLWAACNIEKISSSKPNQKEKITCHQYKPSNH